MARQATRNVLPSRKTVTLAPQSNKFARNSPSRDGSLNEPIKTNALVAQRPVRQPRFVEQIDKHREPKETVSVAGIFKKSNSNARERIHSRRKEKTYEPQLLTDLQGIPRMHSSKKFDTE